ncbi:P4 alpha zinc-binding domain-containing protein [Aurantimonas sp. 22II-16-19i]|nr:P4 alpha zinc-binding domain-containing protein [Aurantimonas sp. 22II-16-19i]
MDAFVAEARAISVVEAFQRGGGVIGTARQSVRAQGPGGAKYVGPCPACGGRDRFSMDRGKNVYNCRGCGGGDAIGLYQKMTGADFLDACEVLLGRDRPGPARSAADLAEAARRRRAAEARAAQLREEAAERERQRESEAAFYRRRELDRCLDIWSAAGAFFGSEAERYLVARGLDPSQVNPAYLRCVPRLTYWGRDAEGRNAALHEGPAMVAVFVVPETGSWRIVGLHQTWIDLDAPAKFRPAIADRQEPGAFLPTKKMRGSKAGGVIPLVGRLSTARRMVAGEGIETVLGFGQREGFDENTFYCAAGDLGNLCGGATRESRFRHPNAVRRDTAGRKRPVWVQGQEPDPDSVAMPVPGHITELVLLGDGDSEPVATRAAMKRGARRHERGGRTVAVVMAPAGTDFGEVAA